MRWPAGCPPSSRWTAFWTARSRGLCADTYAHRTEPPRIATAFSRTARTREPLRTYAEWHTRFEDFAAAFVGALYHTDDELSPDVRAWAADVHDGSGRDPGRPSTRDDVARILARVLFLQVEHSAISNRFRTCWHALYPREVGTTTRRT